jgi:uncharacterized membrane protein (DUF4010 family)
MTQPATAAPLLYPDERRDALLLAVLAAVVLPWIPDQPLAALGGIAPRPLAVLVLVILALQAAGQVAMRALGARGGVLATGLLGGFVSSTATVASLGSQARAEPSHARLFAHAAALSAVSTWVQAALITFTLAPRAAAALAPMALAGALAAGAAGLLALRTPDGTARPPAAMRRSALRPREALLVAAVLAGVAIAVNLARERWGEAGLLAGVALAAAADAHAPVASLAALQAAGTVSAAEFLSGVLLAVGVNTLTRCAIAALTGGAVYARRVAASLAASWVAAAGAWLWSVA